MESETDLLDRNSENATFLASLNGNEKEAFDLSTKDRFDIFGEVGIEFSPLTYGEIVIILTLGLR